MNLLIVEDEKEILNGIMAGVCWEDITRELARR